MSKVKINNELVKDKSIKTNVQLIANTYKNISDKTLISLLHKLSDRVNYKYFRYYKKYPDKKIGMYCYLERVLNNAHCNILIRVPPNYNFINVILDMKQIWKKLDDRKYPKFELYHDFNVKDEIRCTDYARKKDYLIPI